MGYLGNHLATVTTGVFAAVLTGLWPYFVDFAPILNFVFIMAVPITWFLTLMCWLSQKSTDYMHSHAQKYGNSEKKSLTSAQTIVTSAGSQDTVLEIKQIQSELSSELDDIKESIKLKDGKIERLNQEISNLQTLVQIESLKTELANLKMLASKKSKSR